MNHLFQILIAVDQLFNTLFGGWADETLSSRAYRLKRDGGSSTPEKLINCLFFSKTHCQDAYESEWYRSQMPPEFRNNSTN
jgi:hypothetical protein